MNIRSIKNKKSDYINKLLQIIIKNSRFYFYVLKF